MLRERIPFERWPHDAVELLGRARVAWQDDES